MTGSDFSHHLIFLFVLKLWQNTSQICEWKNTNSEQATKQNYDWIKTDIMFSKNKLWRNPTFLETKSNLENVPNHPCERPGENKIKMARFQTNL